MESVATESAPSDMVTSSSSLSPRPNPGASRTTDAADDLPALAAESQRAQKSSALEADAAAPLALLEEEETEEPDASDGADAPATNQPEAAPARGGRFGRAIQLKASTFELPHAAIFVGAPHRTSLELLDQLYKWCATNVQAFSCTPFSLPIHSVPLFARAATTRLRCAPLC